MPPRITRQRKLARRSPLRRNPDATTTRSVHDALSLLAAMPRSEWEPDTDVDLPFRYDGRAVFPTGKRVTGTWEPFFAGERRLPVEGLRVWQHSVDRDTVAGYIRQGPRSVVVVRQRDGHLTVADGHHRLMAAYLLGEPAVSALVYDLR